jgi:hypothetical protein
MRGYILILSIFYLPDAIPIRGAGVNAMPFTSSLMPRQLMTLVRLAYFFPPISLFRRFMSREMFLDVMFVLPYTVCFNSVLFHIVAFAVVSCAAKHHIVLCTLVDEEKKNKD